MALETSPLVALLTDVQVSAGPDGERVEFAFESAVPTPSVEYVPDVVQASGSGANVAVAGAAQLKVRMEPASGADLSGPVLRRTYEGPLRVRGDTTGVSEVTRSGDFEGVLEWVIGLPLQLPFRVETQQSPPRVIIELPR